jgi:hypothetical protein
MMASRLCARGRNRPSARRIAIAALVATLLLLAAFAVAPGRDRKPAGYQPSATSSSRFRATRSVERHTATVSRPDLARARSVARRFLAGYLRFIYGQAAPSSVRGTAPSLRHQLNREQPVAVPAERRRHPHLISLTAAGLRGGVVRATALVYDGGIANYGLRLTIRRTSRGWLVSSVDEG